MNRRQERLEARGIPPQVLEMQQAMTEAAKLGRIAPYYKLLVSTPDGTRAMQIIVSDEAVEHRFDELGEKLPETRSNFATAVALGIAASRIRAPYGAITLIEARPGQTQCDPWRRRIR